jgi:broad specificity phosphatase PhoE
MNLHVTRHGQVDQKTQHPVGDPYLSDLGREQARKLGERLKDLGFRGTVYSSPFLRTVETANIVAEVVDAPVVPAAPMREYVIREGQMVGFRGATVAELKDLHSKVVKPSEFVYPWWTDAIETPEDIEARVEPLIEEVVKDEEDALLVGHGASVGGVHRYILKKHAPDQMGHGQYDWNCILSSFAFGGKVEVVRIMDTEHLPEEMITANAKSKAEVLEERSG